MGDNQKVPHTVLNDLLCILRRRNMDGIPKDARTLLQTPTQVTCRTVSPGEYCHFGIKHPLTKILNCVVVAPSKLELNFNIDGLPISNSSKGQFWPILCSIKNFSIRPFAIGIYYGHTKPNCAKEYLKDFLREVKELLINGFMIKKFWSW